MWKDGVVAIVGSLIDDLLAIYDQISYPIRRSRYVGMDKVDSGDVLTRLRVLVRYLEYCYYSRKEIGDASHLGGEVVELLGRLVCCTHSVLSHLALT